MDGLTNGRPSFPYPPLRFAGAGDNNIICLRCLQKHIKISKCYNFNENWYVEDFRPEECDSDKCDLKMVAIAAILAAIFNMVAKTHKIFRSTLKFWCVFADILKMVAILTIFFLFNFAQFRT
jgi:hypothetical protein